MLNPVVQTSRSSSIRSSDVSFFTFIGSSGAEKPSMKVDVNASKRLIEGNLRSENFMDKKQKRGELHGVCVDGVPAVLNNINAVTTFFRRAK
jgi:hypothetical protein